MSEEPRVLAGRYRVDELIGHGGMAKVYRGYDLTLERDVAIKILDPERARDIAFRTRFRLEAQSASRMSHSTIVRVYDAGEQDNGSGTPEPYIVMELVTGTLLKTIIANGPVPTADAVRYTSGILDALEYSHKAGVIHRDIKPGNVMITEAGQVKVMDFGIARAVSDSSSTVAQTTQIIGTASYFSPEQAKGEPVDARADLYSTGIVLYELLTGRPPFRGDSPVAVAYQHVSETPDAPSEVSEHAPGAFDPVVLQALAKDPYQRFPDAASFRAALEAAAAGRAPSKKQLGALTNELYGPSPRQAQETARSLRQLTSDTTMSRTQSGPPVAWIWAGVALLIALIAAVVFWVVAVSQTQERGSTNPVVPEVIEQPLESAQEQIEELGLTVKIERDNSSEITENDVIRTDPGPGTTVTKGSTVIVYVSEGAKMVTVPTILNLSASDASEALEKAGLKVAPYRSLNDPDHAKDVVLAANVEEGAEVLPDTTVILTVASGNVTVRDVQGWTLEAATRELEGLGLVPVQTALSECPATDPATVKAMNPAPGDLPVHSEVELRYCEGEASSNATPDPQDNSEDSDAP